jgi:DNA-directed RNA polymerase subunit RPC12/RpoP
MSISFHCEHCGKRIQAPDTAAGKKGKCPACHNQVFVPPAEMGDDELKLAPINESEIEREKRLIAESFKLRQSILSETAEPDEGKGVKPAKPAAIADDKKVTAQIVTYLKLMVNGDIDKAERIANGIKSFGDQAADILDQIAYGEKSLDELEDIPQQVLFGMIKELQEKLR